MNALLPDAKRKSEDSDTIELFLDQLEQRYNILPFQREFTRMVLQKRAENGTLYLIMRKGKYLNEITSDR